jgi:MerR family transcriptional regulator, light-induced transcriptional regulator
MAGQVREHLEAREFDLGSAGFAHEDGGLRAADAALPTQRSRRRRVVPTGQILARTVQAEIIPRLVLALREANRADDTPGRASTAACCSEVAEFAQIILAGNIAEACASIDAMRSAGQSLEQIYLDLIEPTARRLGDLWNADVCDFVVVTVGVLRLQQVLHEFALAFRRESEPREHGHRALLVPASGEKGCFGHLMFGTFGLVMAAEFLRRDGWDAYIDSSASAEEAAALVRREWFDIIEMSLSSEGHLAELAAGIRQIRRASRNRAIGVIVSGPVFRNHPEMVTSVGADAAATDGRQAALQADSLMELLRRR